jgi:hypothetical protein
MYVFSWVESTTDVTGLHSRFGLVTPIAVQNKRWGLAVLRNYGAYIGGRLELFGTTHIISIFKVYVLASQKKEGFEYKAPGELNIENWKFVGVGESCQKPRDQ